MSTNKWAVSISNSTLLNPFGMASKQPTVQNIINFFRSLPGKSKGEYGSTVIAGAYNQVAASGYLTVSSASGTVGGAINGVTCTVTAVGTDLATAVLIAGKINTGGNTPNALVSKHVTAIAVDDGGTIKVVITAINPGFSGNAVTLSATGTGLSASGARLTGGTETQVSYTYP